MEIQVVEMDETTPEILNPAGNAQEEISITPVHDFQSEEMELPSLQKTAMTTTQQMETDEIAIEKLKPDGHVMKTESIPYQHVRSIEETL